MRSLHTALALLLVPAARAQELGWSTLYERPLEFPQMRALAAHSTPDDGVVSVQYGLSSTETMLVAVKFSANGDQEWSYEARTNATPAAAFGIERNFASGVSPDGSVYLASDRGRRGFLVKIEPDGTLAWEQILSPLPTGFSVAPAGLGFLPGGDVVLVSSAFYGSVPRNSIARFAPGGALIFRRETLGVAGAGHPLGMDVSPNGTILVYGMSDAPFFVRQPRASTFDANGGVLSSPVIAAPSEEEEFAWGAIDALDRVTVLMDVNGVPSGEWAQEIFSFDPLGGTRWSLSSSSANGDSRATSYALSERGRLTLGGRNVPGEPWVEKRDAMGGLVWSQVLSSGPGAQGNVRGIWADTQETVVLGTSGACRFVARFDAAGVEQSSVCLPDQPFANSSDGLDLDSRGNVLMHDRTAQGDGVVVSKALGGTIVGSSFCGPAAANSSGESAAIRAFGFEGIQRNNVSLLVGGLPQSVSVLFLVSQTAANVPGAGGGQGTLCLGGEVGRYLAPGQVRRSNGAGVASLQLDLAAIPQPTGAVPGTAGMTWNWQAWFRDANPAVTSNLSDAVAVTLQ